MRSVFLGVGIALVQSLLSTGALAWAWNRKSFYWVWAGAFFFRFAVFAATAYGVHVHSTYSLVAVLLSLVTATTIFLVAEYYVCFGNKKNGFSSSSRTSPS